MADSKWVDATTAAIVQSILADVTERRGWRQEWEGFDPDTQAEIMATWAEKIEDILRERTP